MYLWVLVLLNASTYKGVLNVPFKRNYVSKLSDTHIINIVGKSSNIESC